MEINLGVFHNSLNVAGTGPCAPVKNEDLPVGTPVLIAPRRRDILVSMFP